MGFLSAFSFAATAPGPVSGIPGPPAIAPLIPSQPSPPQISSPVVGAATSTESGVPVISSPQGPAIPAGPTIPAVTAIPGNSDVNTGNSFANQQAAAAATATGTTDLGMPAVNPSPAPLFSPLSGSVSILGGTQAEGAPSVPCVNVAGNQSNNRAGTVGVSPQPGGSAGASQGGNAPIGVVGCSP